MVAGRSPRGDREDGAAEPDRRAGGDGEPDDAARLVARPVVRPDFDAQWDDGEHEPAQDEEQGDALPTRQQPVQGAARVVVCDHGQGREPSQSIQGVYAFDVVLLFHGRHCRDAWPRRLQ